MCASVAQQWLCARLAEEWSVARGRWLDSTPNGCSECGKRGWKIMNGSKKCGAGMTEENKCFNVPADGKPWRSEPKKQAAGGFFVSEFVSFWHEDCGIWLSLLRWRCWYSLANTSIRCMCVVWVACPFHPFQEVLDHQRRFLNKKKPFKTCNSIYPHHHVVLYLSLYHHHPYLIRHRFHSLRCNILPISIHRPKYTSMALH